MRRGLILLVAAVGLLSACTGTRQDAGAQPIGDPQPAFEQRAAQVAQFWQGDAGKAWRSGLIVLGERTIAPERGFPDGDTKEAFLAGRYRLAATLSNTPGQGVVKHPDGTSLPVAIIGALDGYQQMATPSTCSPTQPPNPAPGQSGGPDTGVSSPVGPCTWLTVTGATLTTAKVRTNHGLDEMPVWAYSLKEVAKPVARLAVAPSALTAKPEVTGLPAMGYTQGLVSTQGLSKVETSSIDFKLGVGACDTNIRPLAWENDKVIVLGGAVDPPAGEVSCVAMLKLEPVRVVLKQPVGERLIVDAFTGQPIETAWF